MATIRRLLPLATFALIACGGDGDLDETRDLSLAPAESLTVSGDVAQSAPPQSPAATQSTSPRSMTQTQQPTVTRRPPPAPSARELAVGTELALIASDSLVAKEVTVGHGVTATLATAVLDASGREVIPAGAQFTGYVANIDEAAEGYQGHMLLRFDQVSFGGQTYGIQSATTSVGTRTQKGGVTAGDAAKVGAGAVVGAIAGRVLGGNKTGTAVGAAVGTAAGVGVAVATKGEDVYLDAGAPIRIVLTTPFVR